MRNVGDKNYIENQNTRLRFKTFFENQAVVVVQGRSQIGNIIRRMLSSCCIPKATNTHSEYVILLYCCNNRCANAP